MSAEVLPHRHCWLREPVDRFLDHLHERRYANGTILHHARLLLAFGDFAARQRAQEVAQLPQQVDAFVATMRGTSDYRRKRRAKLVRFLDFLRYLSILPPPPDPPPTLGTEFIDEYLRTLREQHGLRPTSVELIRRSCLALMGYLAAEGIDDLRTLRADVIHRLIASQGRRYSRATVRIRCSVLRGFLSFLYRRGAVGLDLAGAVVSPVMYRHEQCPRFLTRSEIDTVLGTVDRRTPAGKRDYAMLLLLATYGLRGIEVVHLRLDDLDWRKQVFHVRDRKAGNSSSYPLSVAVGEAILGYLRDVRPTSPDRELFLRLQAPFTPLVSRSLCTLVRNYLRRAGIRVARPGTHSFRYSCAQRLFDQGVPLKSIGDFLGHRTPDSTQRYTKIALEQLREVAASDGEDLL